MLKPFQNDTSLRGGLEFRTLSYAALHTHDALQPECSAAQPAAMGFGEIIHMDVHGAAPL